MSKVNRLPEAPVFPVLTENTGAFSYDNRFFLSRCLDLSIAKPWQSILQYYNDNENQFQKNG